MVRLAACRSCSSSFFLCLLNADQVPRRVAEGTVAYAPRLGRGLLEHLGARCPHLLEGGVEVVRAEDRSLQRPLGHERQEGIALRLRAPTMRLREDDVEVLSWAADGHPAEFSRLDVVADLETERVAIE